MAKRNAVKRARRRKPKRKRSKLEVLSERICATLEADGSGTINDPPPQPCDFLPVSTPDYTPPVSDDGIRRLDMDMVNFWRSIKFTPNFRPQTVLNDGRQPRQTSDRRSPNRTLSAMNDRRKGERRKTSA